MTLVLNGVVMAMPFFICFNTFVNVAFQFLDLIL